MPAFPGILPGSPTRIADRQTGQQGTNTSVQRTSFDYGVNQAWLTAAMIACILLAWLKLLALDGDLAKAEPKTLRYLLRTMQAELQGCDVVPGHGGCIGAQGPLRLTSRISSEEMLGGQLSTVCPVSVAIRLAT